MARAVVVATLAFGLAAAASLAADRFWPKAHAEPFALVGAGLVMLGAASPRRAGRLSAALEARPPDIALPVQQQRAG